MAGCTRLSYAKQVRDQNPPGFDYAHLRIRLSDLPENLQFPVAPGYPRQDTDLSQMWRAKSSAGDESIRHVKGSA